MNTYEKIIFGLVGADATMLIEIIVWAFHGGLI